MQGRCFGVLMCIHKVLLNQILRGEVARTENLPLRKLATNRDPARFCSSGARQTKSIGRFPLSQTSASLRLLLHSRSG
jgi:hypothetical protein